MKVEELQNRLNQGAVTDVVDVREREEYEAGDKIPGSTNIPMGQMFVEANAGRLPKDRKIVTICKTGGRCEIVARELGKKGYDIEYIPEHIE